jgi:hypothetical protein
MYEEQFVGIPNYFSRLDQACAREVQKGKPKYPILLAKEV